LPQRDPVSPRQTRQAAKTPVSCAKQTRSRPLAVSSVLDAMHEALQEVMIHAQPISSPAPESWVLGASR
jgi:hypothetical protein